ncbi:MAG: hypothetical protein O3A23_05680, partial [Proteobacteria bacterium]|nr:hypothetical protein [Pseudomonadota bacterium]
MRERNNQASNRCLLQNVLQKISSKKVCTNYVLRFVSAAVVSFALPSIALAQGEIRESASHRFEE